MNVKRWLISVKMVNVSIHWDLLGKNISKVESQKFLDLVLAKPES
jgi:hypothetical protein